MVGVATKVQSYSGITGQRFYFKLNFAFIKSRIKLIEYHVTKIELQKYECQMSPKHKFQIFCYQIFSLSINPAAPNSASNSFFYLKFSCKSSWWYYTVKLPFLQLLVKIEQHKYHDSTMGDVRCKSLRASGTACPHFSKISINSPTCGASSLVRKLCKTPLTV